MGCVRGEMGKEWTSEETSSNFGIQRFSASAKFRTALGHTQRAAIHKLSPPLTPHSVTGCMFELVERGKV